MVSFWITTRILLVCCGVDLAAAQNIVLQDGSGHSGSVLAAGTQPLDGGTGFEPTIHSTYPVGFTYGAGEGFKGAVIVDDYLWMIPRAADRIVRVHRTTGVMTGYNSWPGAVTVGPKKFGGGAYDSASGLIWFAASSATHVVNIDTTTGNFGYCGTAWPAGWDGAGKTYKHLGIILDPILGNLWMAPTNAHMIVKVSTSTCAMTGFWPAAGFTWVPQYVAVGIVSSGTHAFVVPYRCSHVVKVDMTTGAITLHSSWPSGFTISQNYDFQSGTFDGQNVWLAPCTESHVLSVDKDTGTMAGYDGFPAGMSASGTGHIFGSTLYDGKFVWMVPFEGNMVVRLDPSSGLMKGYFSPITVYSAALDFATNSIWAPPAEGSDGANVLVQLRFGRTTTQEAPGGLMLQTGASGDSERVPLSRVAPLTGENIAEIATTVSVPGFANNEINFGAALVLGDYVWLVPRSNSKLIRVHKGTMQQTGFDALPSGVTFSTTSHYIGGCHDHERNRIWLVPRRASHLVYFEIATERFGFCETWPAGYSNPSYGFGGGVMERDYLWMPPLSNNMMVRTNMADCTMKGYSSWPSSPYVASVNPFLAIVFDGDQGVWLLPYTGSHVVKVDTWTDAMTIYNGWPSGFSTTPWFSGGTFDGQLIWATPYNANMVVSVDKGSGLMAGYNNYPQDWAPTATVISWGALFDGRFIWVSPYAANMLLRLDPLTGVFKGFVVTGQEFFGVTVDFTTKSLWMAPGSHTTLVQAQFHTQTAEIGLVLQDGTSSSGTAEGSIVKPLEGPMMTTTRFGTSSTGCASSCYGGGVLVGDYLWLHPFSGFSKMVRVHRITGAVAVYNAWPGGTFTYGSFYGSAYDRKRDLIWLVPYQASHPVSVNPNTGAMAYCPTWPASWDSLKPLGGFIERETYFWMIPYTSQVLVQVDMGNCNMLGHTSWPGGFVPGSALFLGGVFDGDHHAWLFPFLASHWVQVNVWTGTMTGYNTWPGGFAPGTVGIFSGGAFDGQTAWMAPREANMIGAVDKDTGAMTGHNAWPTGFALATRSFRTATYDGKYVWFPPQEVTAILRVEAATGQMASFTNLPVGWAAAMSVVVDHADNSMWITPFLASAEVVKCVFGTSPTQEIGLIVSDGVSYNGVVPWSDTKPFEGKIMRTTSYSAWPGSFVSGTHPFIGAILVGDYLWMAPRDANMVVKMHKTSGAMTGYNTWPAGLTFPGTKFAAPAYDPVRGVIWLGRETASHMTYIDVTTGTMGTCPSWPAGFSGWGFLGSLIDRETYLWLAPFGADRIVQLDMRDCTMQGYNSWPAAMTASMAAATGRFTGVVFDGDHHAWFVPWEPSHVLKMNLWDKAMTPYNTWPTGWSVSGTGKFGGGAFDGQSIWMGTFSANMVVKVDKDTGAMTGFDAWPAGYVPGTNTCDSVSFDGKYVWLFPRDASHLVRIEASTGATFGFSNWPSGFGGTFSTALDFATQTIWLPPWGGTDVLQLSFPTSTDTGTHLPTRTLEDGLLIQNGYGSPGIVAWAEVKPLEGTTMTALEFTTFPAGIVCGNNCFQSVVVIEDFVWAIPRAADRVIKMHKHTGTMSDYAGWPGGVTVSGVSKFAGGVFHQRTNTLWMVPRDASHIVYVDVASGAMGACLTWPTGVTLGGDGFISSLLYHETLWAPPYIANRLISAELNDCALSSFSNWPAGVTLGSYKFHGAIFDGDRGGWFTPAYCSHIVKMDFHTGTMTGYNSWPAGINTPPATGVKLMGGVFDGQSIWAAPFYFDRIIKIDPADGTMTGFNSWPTGFTVGSTYFQSAVYDGKYVWFPPRSSNMLIRIQSSSGTLTGFSNWPAGFSQSQSVMVDFDTGSLWLCYFSGTRSLIRLTFHTETKEATPSQDLGLVLQDGIAQSGTVPLSAIKPMDGTKLILKQDPLTAAGFSCTTNCFRGGFFIGDHYWLIPYKNAEVLRIHTSTLVGTSFSTWPSGPFALDSTNGAFHGGVHDPRGGRIWMTPHMASHPAYIDTTTGSVGYCSTFPAGYVAGTLSSAVLERGFVWMAPSAANMMLRVNVLNVDCTMVGYSAWPTGFTSGVEAFHGMVFDGDHKAWLVRYRADMIVHLNMWTGDVSQGYGDGAMPAGFVAAAGSQFCGGTFDGQFVWFAPTGANMIVKMDKDSGTATGFNSWPSGFTSSTIKFMSAAFDGAYVWFSPRDASHLLRIEVASGTVWGFNTWPGSWTFSLSCSLHFNSGQTELWLPLNGPVLYRLYFATDTQSITRSEAPTPSTTATMTISPAPTPSHEATATVAAPPLTPNPPTPLPTTLVPPTPALTSAAPAVTTPSSTTAAPVTPQIITSTGFPTPGLSVTFSVGSPTPSSILVQVSAVANPPPTCGNATHVLSNGTHVDDVFTVRLFPTASAGTVTLQDSVWLLRNASVTISVLAPLGGPPLATQIDLVPQHPVLDYLSGGAVITGVSPTLAGLRGLGATHLTVSGTGLTSLPPVMLIGPWALHVSVSSSTMATVGPVPSSGATVAQVLASLAHPLGTVDSHVALQGTLALLGHGNPGRCPVEELKAALSSLPPATPIDFTDFAVYPNGSVTLLPQLAPRVSFPTEAFLLGRSYPTVEAGGVALENIVAGVQFLDLAGAFAGHSSALLGQMALTSTLVATQGTSSWAQLNATHHTFSVAQSELAQSSSVNLTIHHKWGWWRELVQQVSIPVIRPALQVSLVNIPSTVRRQKEEQGNINAKTVKYAVRLTAKSLDGSPANVTANLVVESNGLGAGVSIKPQPTDQATKTMCTNTFPNQECTLPQLTIGLAVVLDFVVTVPGYYRSGLKVSYTVTAPAALAPATGTLDVVNWSAASGSASTSGNSAVTQSPPRAAAAGGSSPIFGFSSSAPCIDALFMSWLVWVAVMAVLVVVSLHLSRSVFKGHQAPSHAAVKPTAEETEIEQKRAAWRDASAIRSLLLQNKWLTIFVPCHDQCAVGHGLTSFAHLLTIMWVAAALVLAVSGGSAEALPVTSTVAIAIVTILLVQPMGILLGAYYSHSKDSFVVLAEGGIIEQCPRAAAAPSLPAGSTAQESPTSRGHGSAVARTQMVTQVNVTGLEDVELADEQPDCGKGNLDGTDSEEDGSGGTTKETSKEEPETVEDDVILEKKEEGEEEEGGQQSDGKLGTGNRVVNGGTFQALKQQEAEAGMHEEIGTITGGGDIAGLTVNVIGSRDQGNGGEDEEEAIASGVLYSATPYRKVGHLINGVYVVLATMLTLILGFPLRPSNNSGLCPTYLSDVLPLALITDFLLVQPLSMALLYVYRWMVSDPDNGQPIDLALHPRDCLVRDVYEEED